MRLVKRVSLRSGIIALVACVAVVAAAAEGLAGMGGAGQAMEPMVLAAAQANPGDYSGEVIESFISGGYVYVQLDTGDEKVWAAAPQQDVRVGDKAKTAGGVPMVDFHSKTLDRTFDRIYFVDTLTVERTQGQASPTADMHAGIAKEAQASAVDLSGIAKAKDGKTVAEIFDERSSLASQQVSLRGKVVKFTQGIMGKNWIHVQDGTAGAQGADDLTVTTASVVTVGDTILVRGAVAVDKDFGFGYKYDVIMEDATVEVE